MADGIHHTCPYCGGCDLAIVENTKGIVERIEHWVRCRQCHATGPIKVLRTNAIEAWNLRVEARIIASLAAEEM